MTHTKIYGSLPATLAAAVLAAGVLVGCSGKSAEQAAAPDAAAAPAQDNKYAELAKLPDWSGAWEPARMARPATPPAGATGTAPASTPPPSPPKPPQFTPKYAAMYAAFQEKNRATPGINFV